MKSRSFSIRQEADSLLVEFAPGGFSRTDPDKLDTFTRSYLAAMLQDLEERGQESDEERDAEVDFSISSVAPRTLSAIVADCKKFQDDNADALAAGTDRAGGQWSADELAGTDFWLTRNHAGAGFWDGNWVEGKALTDAAHAFGEAECYVGDDGLIYQSGKEGDWRLKSFTSPNASGGLIDRVTVTDKEPAPAADAQTYSAADPDDEDEERFESKALDLAQQLIEGEEVGDELEGGPEDEDVICPACTTMQPKRECTLGSLGNQAYCRCRYCGADWRV